MNNESVLDQLDKVRTIDRHGMIQLCERTPEFCRDAQGLVEKVEIPDRYGSAENLIIAGVGGSAIGGELVKDWLYDKAMVPIRVCRDYVLPAYANERTLVVAVSYSGETEETLNAFVEAMKHSCMVITASSGGHLKAFSHRLHVPHIALPSGFPPRAAIAYIFFPLAVLMGRLNFLKETESEIQEAFQVLKRVRDENALEIPIRKNKAKKLALSVKGTIPVVYGYRHYGAVARRMKCQFNENSKIPSKFDMFSELNHNEIVGWQAPEDFARNFSLILLRDPDEPPEMKVRIDATKQILSQRISRIFEIQAVGRLKLAKMLSTLYLGDFVSIYLALAREIDPTPTETIAYLKDEMRNRLDTETTLREQMKKIEREVS